MSITTTINGGFQTLEYQKFIEINNSTFPPVTAYWENDLSSKTQVFPKTAILTYDTSVSELNSQPFGDNAAVDAFGRLRVSSPITTFSLAQLYSRRTNIFDEVINGSGSISFSQANAGTTLSTTVSGDYVIRQLKQNTGYKPGKSQQYFFTGILSGGDDIDMKYGYFTSNTIAPYNQYTGFYFQNNNNVISVNIGNVNGNQSSLSVPQSAWNIDKLDGTGNSGYTLDVSKVQIFTIDYQWLGAGRVRFGFDLNGTIVYCHEVFHANTIESTYLTNPNLPLRVEIRQTGATPASLLHMSATVNYEGSNTGKHAGELKSIDTMDYTGLNAPLSISVGTECSLMQLSLSSIMLQGYLELQSIGVLNTDPNIDSRIRLILDPSHTGTVSLTSVPESALAWGIGGSGMQYISGGNVLSTRYISKDNATSIDTIDDGLFTLGAYIGGDSTVLHVMVAPLKSGGAGSGAYYASFHWHENE